MSQQAPVRPDASMTLLTEVYEHPLDPSYEEAARHRAEGTAYGHTPLTRVLVAVLAMAMGFGLAWAVRSLRAPAVDDEARTLLIEQIVQRREVQAALVAANDEIAAQNAELSAEILANSDPALARRLEQLGMSSATVAVRGDAVVITLSDSAQAQEDPGAFPEERVQAFDLQLVVNALWGGGAEAVAINGTRLGATGAIRGAGLAVLVDLVPVTSPYEVVAIGPVDEMREFLARSTASTQLAVLRDQYHLGVSSDTRDDAWLPAVRSVQLRHAVQLDDDQTTGDPSENGSQPSGEEEESE